MKPAYCRPTDLKNRALSKDPKLVEDLFACFKGELTSFLRSRCGSEEDAEDAFQEAFASVASKIDTYRGDAPISSWIFTLAKNACIKNHRTLKDKKSIHQPHDETVQQDPFDELKRMENAIEAQLTPVQKALEKLSEIDQSVLILRDGQEMTAKEVASELGITEAAVKSRLHRARKQIQEYLT